VALHHLLTVEGSEIYCCARSRDQARTLFQYAARFARELDHPNVVHRHLELRYCADPNEPRVFSGCLRVLPAEAPGLYGLTPSLMFLDEMQALDRDDVYVALSSRIEAGRRGEQAVPRSPATSPTPAARRLQGLRLWATVPARP
jgi:hypothetical protein